MPQTTVETLHFYNSDNATSSRITPISTAASRRIHVYSFCGTLCRLWQLSFSQSEAFCFEKGGYVADKCFLSTFDDFTFQKRIWLGTKNLNSLIVHWMNHIITSAERKGYNSTHYIHIKCIKSPFSGIKLFVFWYQIKFFKTPFSRILSFR